jgi:hypothetical protein
MRVIRTLAAGLLTLVAITGARAQQQPVVTGLWQQVDPATGRSEAWFLFTERNGLFEGAIAKMFPEPGDEPNPICSRCEGDQKDARFLGLAIIHGMKRHGLDYEDGDILDPRDGTHYRALMRLSPDGQTLIVRGFIGIALFGRDQTWTRLPESAYDQLDPSVNPRAASASPPPAQPRPAKSNGTAPAGAPAHR